MTPLLKSLLGNGSKDREMADEMREVLQQMQQERGRCETLIESVRRATDRLGELGEPITRASGDVDAVVSRLAGVEQRFAALAQLVSQMQDLDERARHLIENQQQAETRISSTLEETQEIRKVFEELSQKVDLAVGLKDRLVDFLEVEKPFQVLRGDAETLRGQVDGTGEQIARLREHHDRLMDAHKLAVSKMEALDRRRDDLGRSMQDKERRVAAVEQAMHGMDGVQQTVDGVRRDIGALKALGDAVVQKTAALEAQRDSVERALAQADHLERAMKQVDAGVRQQQENERALAALQDDVTTLRSLHEAVIERSAEISQLQRDTDERTRATRQDLGTLTDEMKKTVERFDFESRGLESVSQRVADLRGALTDSENRFKSLSESNLLLTELGTRSKDLAAQLGTLSAEVGTVDQEMETFRTIRRDLDETSRIAREAAGQLGQIEAARPAVEAGLRDLEHLRGAHVEVRDALEQSRLAHDEITRLRETQAETRSWLAAVEQSMGELRERVGEVQGMGPAIEVLQQRAQRLDETVASIESRREFVEDLNRRMVALGSVGGKLEERSRQMQAQMEAAEQRFAGLAASSEEAARLTMTIAEVTAAVNESARKADETGKAISAFAARCRSVEDLAEQTRALRPEIEQRHQAVAEATRDLQRAAALRKEGAASTQKLEELAQQLAATIGTAEKRVAKLDELTAEIEERSAHLKSVEKRLDEFEGRLEKWDPVEKEIARSLDQIAARQGTVESLQADLDRMFSMAEKTASEVREITSATQEVEQSRQLLGDVMERLREVRNTASALDERKRQMTKAEDRLARAEALLVDVRSSLEALQGQKALVDQAVEKTGSLQFLLKQAEATIEGLRGEREMTTRVRAAVAIVGRDEDDDDAEARAA